MGRHFTDGQLWSYEVLMKQPPRNCEREETLADMDCKYCIRNSKRKCVDCPYTDIIFEAMLRDNILHYSNRFGDFSLNGRVVIPREI